VDVFDKSDHNDHVDNWKSELDFLSNAGVGGDLLPQLASIVSAMRYVKNYGETTSLAECTYTADDHNRFMQAFSILMQIIDSVGVTGDDVDKLRNLVAQMRSIKFGEIYSATMHNLFAQAWELVSTINTIIAKVPPPMQSIYMEDWDYTKAGPYAQIYAEPWSYSEPPAYESRYFEQWTKS